MLNLVVQSTGEPVGEQTGVNITASNNLLGEEIHVDGLLLGDDGHTVVIEGEDKSKKVSTDSLGDEEINDHVDGVLDEEEHGRKVPGPVHSQRELLDKGDGDAGSRGLVGLAVGENKEDRLEAPGETGKGQDGEVEPGLVQDHEARPHPGQFLIGHIRKHLQSVLTPGQQGVSINIGILSMNVRRSVVGVVLILPPGGRETLANTSEEGSKEVSPEAILEDLMMQEIVGKPAALLPEETQDRG